jgi:hypothetical protein
MNSKPDWNPEEPHSHHCQEQPTTRTQPKLPPQLDQQLQLQLLPVLSVLVQRNNNRKRN